MNQPAETAPPRVAPRPVPFPWYFQVGGMVTYPLALLPFQYLIPHAFYFFLIALICPAIFLAVAGKGNRLFFSGVMVVMAMLGYMAYHFLRYTDLFEFGLAGTLLVCTLVPLSPALLVWLAHTVRQRAR